MITEDYVSFEIAKLLKEKGFDEHCFCINYPTEGGHHNIILPNLLNNSMIPFTSEYKFCRYKEDFVTIPTLQMAMKWLRKEHNIHVVPKFDFYAGDYNGRIYDGRRESAMEKDDYIALVGNSTYEKACEVAIKYCLEKLI